MPITLQKCTLADAPTWLAMQVETHTDYLTKYQDHEINPAAETLERVIKRMDVDYRDHFFILQDGNIVGGVRTAWYRGTTRYRLGGLFILPQYQNQGIGQIVVPLAESLYPNATSWELETLLQEPRNLHFYEKLGYRREGEPTIINDKLSLVFYKKHLPP